MFPSKLEFRFEGAPLGDKRLTRRLVTSAAVQAECSSFLPWHRGEVPWYPATVAWHENAVREHFGGARMQGQDVALCVGSDLNFSVRPGC